ncbi:MAG TPA: tyrosine-type recombinase/integrase [Tepidisphaeraceae bacterium]
MASIYTEPNGRRRILFIDKRDRKRKTIRLGLMSEADASEFRDMLDELLAANLRKRLPEKAARKWLADLDDEFHEKLAKIELVEPRTPMAPDVGPTLTRFMDEFFADLTGKKPATLISYGNVRRNLEEHFGKDKPLRDIGTKQADGWRAWLVEHEEKGANGKTVTKRLSIPTISRRVIAARTIWHKAIRWKMVSENPFVGVAAGQQVNEDRKFMVSVDVIRKAIDEAPDAEWKVIIALARFGGLRTPSETFLLRWSDIDFDNGKMRVRSPKTERHAGKASREVPLFAELRPYLEELFNESAAEGAVHVVTKHRLGGLNLRTEFMRIIDRAGLTPWPKLFHNLRASRESELMREYDLATVCKWIGNSPAVAAKHYATSVDLNADFKRAAGVVQNPAHRTAPPEPAESCEPVTDGEKRPAGAEHAPTGSGGWAVQGSNL